MRFIPEWDDGPDEDEAAIVETIRRCGSLTEWVGGFEAFGGDSRPPPKARMTWAVPTTLTRQQRAAEKAYESRKQAQANERAIAETRVKAVEAENARLRVDLAAEREARRAIDQRRWDALRAEEYQRLAALNAEKKRQEEVRWAGVRAYQEGLMREHLAKNARQAP